MTDPQPSELPQWLAWARRLQAIAQTGQHYAQDPFDRERYQQIHDLACEITATHTGLAPAAVAELFAAERGYATPKVDVRAAVFREDRILLVRERQDGLWTLPGGWADVGDRPAKAAEREVFEESGFRAHVQKLIAVLDRDSQGHPPYPFAVYKLHFLCVLDGGLATTSYETTAVDFFAEDALPPLSLPRITPDQIRRCFTHHREPTLPTEFD
jgi:ADP-ribose pyrophosphatase YjhB (NUDIX family)